MINTLIREDVADALALVARGCSNRLPRDGTLRGAASRSPAFPTPAGGPCRALHRSSRVLHRGGRADHARGRPHRARGASVCSGGRRVVRPERQRLPPVRHVRRRHNRGLRQ